MSENATPAPGAGEPPTIHAAKYADWQQVAFNGGPPCFHVDADARRFCLRAERWQGHGIDRWRHDHAFVSLADLLAASSGGAAPLEQAGRINERAAEIQTRLDEIFEAHSPAVCTVDGCERCAEYYALLSSTHSLVVVEGEAAPHRTCAISEELRELAKQFTGETRASLHYAAELLDEPLVCPTCRASGGAVPHPLNDPAHPDYYGPTDNRHDWAVRVIRNHVRDPQALATAATIILSDYGALKGGAAPREGEDGKAETIRAVLTNEVLRAVCALRQQQQVCRGQAGQVTIVSGMDAAREYLVEQFASALRDNGGSV